MPSINKVLRRTLIGLAVLALLVYVAFELYQPQYRFEGLKGPDGADRIQGPPDPVSRLKNLSRHATGSPSRLAILLTDENSNWLSLVHGLKTIGIPLRVTQDHQEALKHRVVLVYPTVSGRLLKREALQGLAAHVRNGGTLIGFEVLGGGMDETFGFSRIDPVKGKSKLKIGPQFATEAGLATAEETTLPLSTEQRQISSYMFTPTVGEVLAQYEDGAAAVIRRKQGSGQAYAFGLDLGYFINGVRAGRHEPPTEDYINAYTPAVDVLLRWMLHIYRTSEPMAVTLGTVPGGKSASLIITHDVDYSYSLENSMVYAEREAAYGVRATYFVQTKYMRDWNDKIFYNQRGMELTRALHAAGMELASHSVSHSRSFAEFPAGTGSEAYPSYLPFVRGRWSFLGGSILGELRVSRFLLESALGPDTVHSFRPGHLVYPRALPQSMQATGYRYSSSMSSGLALSHLPFQLNFDRSTSGEVNVYEFPITIEDEMSRPMTGRLDAALQVMAKLQRYGGMMVVLIHPNVLEDKLQFLEGLLARTRQSDIWTGTLREFGHWWTVRDQVQLDVQAVRGGYVADIGIPTDATGISLQLPTGWVLGGFEMRSGTAVQRGNMVNLEGVRGTARLRLHKQGAPELQNAP